MLWFFILFRFLLFHFFFFLSLSLSLWNLFQYQIYIYMEGLGSYLCRSMVSFSLLWTLLWLDGFGFWNRLMGKVASDKCHKWVFKEPTECEPNISNYWQSSFDAVCICRFLTSLWFFLFYFPFVYSEYKHRCRFGQ